jgi:hypothetical protein
MSFEASASTLGSRLVGLQLSIRSFPDLPFTHSCGGIPLIVLVSLRPVDLSRVICFLNHCVKESSFGVVFLNHLKDLVGGCLLDRFDF